MNRITADRLEALLAAVQRVRILVVGDAMLDVYLRGVASRISPEAPVPVVRVTEEWRALGGAANVAANVVALGARCTIAACIGDDGVGHDLRNALRAAGIDVEGLVESATRPTTVKTRVMARHQQVARYDREVDEDLDDELAERLAARIRDLVTRVDAIVLEDYNKGVLTRAVIGAAIAAARASGRPVIVDPKTRSFFDYGGATVFKPNLHELEAALRERVRYDDPAWLESIRLRLGCEHLVLTLGEEGMAVMTAAGEYVRIPTVARSVFDVSGAGDTVTAAVAVALAAGASAAESAVLANHAAAIEVGKLGVATVTPEELRAVIRAAG
ncbi:MAG: D-glycero-beta-D-manno-heptose-7-phosphate kinase [Gemmatimonadetes bacterium]|nr:D-glycero-beta-D-manno-heptose-7-phosphate kinase [Gemmatimonadota bacterium]